MKHNLQMHTLCLVAIPLLITACGGGGSNEAAVEEPVEPSNRAPQAIAGANKSVLESGSVILDARRSSDEDGDRLSYQWVQTAGPEVVLSNPHSPTPSFIAPVVDAATALTFELLVTDAKGDISTDHLTITVADQPSALKQLRVHAINPSLVAPNEGAVTVAFQYTMSEESALPSGLMLKLHWDSSKLAFKELGEVLAVNHLGVSPVMIDVQDDDHNADTDRYVILSWLDYEQLSWPAEISLPAALFSASFEPVSGVSGDTHVTLSPHFNTPGYTLQTQSVSVEL